MFRADCRQALTSIPLVCSIFALGCNPTNQQADDKAKVAAAQPAPQPPIRIDGSSTVHPISEGILDLYASRLVTDIELDFSGTGGGFKKFCNKKTDINGASRPIKSIEDKLCTENEVSYVELPVAFDGVAVVVPRTNDWVDSLTTAELKKIWSAESEGVVLTWKDVRDEFPEKPLHLYGPGIESGTFDFFTSAVNGASGNSRADYTSSEDDNELVAKLSSDESALGYFGLSYHQRYEKQLKLLAIDDEHEENGDGPVVPSPATVAGGEYQPLSRPLFLYVNLGALERSEVVDFVDFYLKSARLVAPDIGAVGLPKDVFSLAHERLRNKKQGSAFSGIHSVVGLTIADLLSAEIDSVTANTAAAPQVQAAAAE